MNSHVQFPVHNCHFFLLIPRIVELEIVVLAAIPTHCKPGKDPGTGDTVSSRVSCAAGLHICIYSVTRPFNPFAVKHRSLKSFSERSGHC